MKKNEMKKVLDKIKRGFIQKIKRGFIQLLIVGFTLQISGLMGLMPITAVRAGSVEGLVINEFMAYPKTGEKEWVEIYNSGSEPVNLTNFKITSTDGSQIIGELLDQIAPKDFVVVENTDKLANVPTTDDVELRDPTNRVIDEIIYGSSGDIAASGKNKTIGRTPDGDNTLATNLNPTKGFSNTQPTRAEIPGGYINSSDQTTVAVEVDIPNGGSGGDGVEVTLIDRQGAVVLATHTPPVSPTTTLSQINVSALVDGPIQLTAQTNHSGDRSESFIGAPAIKDIQMPLSTIATSGYYGPNTWTGSISGTAVDENSGLGTVKLTIQRLSDSQYWNGTVWQTVATDLTTLGTTSWDYTFDKDNLTDSTTYEVKAKAADKAGNQEATTTAQFTYDTIVPIGTVTINSGKAYTHTRNVSLAITGYDAISGLDKMRMAESRTGLTATGWQDFSGIASLTLSSDSGLKTVYLELKDKAGNVSSIDILDSITYIAGLVNDEINAPVTDTLLAGGRLDAAAEYNAEMAVSSGMTGTAFASVATYTSNPGANLQDQGLVAVGGNYYDFSVDEPTAFPVTIRIYYTQKDLSQAGVAAESQIVGLYYYDIETGEWLAFDADLVDPTDFNGYAGFVEVEASHLTPVVMAADITASATPQNFKATAGIGKVELSWDRVDESVGYLIRYRLAASQDASSSYTEVFIAGNEIVSALISGLEEGKEYEFGIASQDRVGNLSHYAVVMAVTDKAEVTVVQKPAAQLAAAEEPLAIGGVLEEEAAQVEEPQRISALPQDIPPQEVKGEEEEKEVEVAGEDRKRLIVALVILVIAIAAGVAGYYGYEWWVSQSDKERTETSKKKKKSNGRW